MVSTKGKWRKALEGEADAFVAAGGDGTVHKLIHALDGRDSPIAILPTGSANNVAYSLGFDRPADLAARVARWPENERVLQMACAMAAEDSRPFLEAAGTGAFASILGGKSSKVRSAAPVALLGIRRRLARAVLEAQPARVSLTIGSEVVEDEYVLLECLNLSSYGPRLQLAPRQAPDAATLTVAGVRAPMRGAFAHWIATGEGDPETFAVGRAKVIRMISSKVIHVDGDVWPESRGGERQLELEAGVRAVRLWV